ncbi:toll/interleukin-1 receptor domain-containing protein [Aquiflexum sp. TKW24L]|uniref:toll/interleukin-1 receptor domain-containing protein n=1 Tax=Aquiflexum sp. TKW24L TaxID=2942212 RepID=UPI0020C00D4F|nr:toll/interleukin-1 receptor domain-containing protein [Aquiflexum sp. TKW24L]MCL6257467.1 toll/interleukin-1 receptor domain-containing protein [Aquiflexum sp. TKW24L]
MKKVFLSYSRQNIEVLKPLIEDLQSTGINIWYDQTLTGGQKWWDNILWNIRECDVFIFCLSTESWNSQACRSELSYVAKLGRTILPILISDGININLMSAPLNQIQIIDIRHKEKEATLVILKSILSAPEKSPLPDTLPDPPPIPISYLSTLKEKIDSNEPMSYDHQVKLLFELEEEIRNGRSPAEVKELLESMKRRDDLLAKISMKIDEFLRGFQGSISDLIKEEIDKSSYRETNPNKYREASSSNKNDSPIPKEGFKHKNFMCTVDNYKKVIVGLFNWLNSEGYDTQQFKIENDEEMIQVKKRGGWRKFVGMETSLNVILKHKNRSLTVYIGSGQWIDKAAVGAVSMVILWPLLVTAGIGAWEQHKLPDKIFEFINTRLDFN